MMNVDGVTGQSRHLFPGFQSRRDRIDAVEAARACFGHGAIDAFIGAAAAEMSR